MPFSLNVTQVDRLCNSTNRCARQSADIENIASNEHYSSVSRTPNTLQRLQDTTPYLAPALRGDRFLVHPMVERLVESEWTPDKSLLVDVLIAQREGGLL